MSVGGSSTLDMRRRSSIQPVYRNSKVRRLMRVSNYSSLVSWIISSFTNFFPYQTNDSARPSIVSDPNINSATKESETSSRSDTPSSSIELNCSKDDGEKHCPNQQLLIHYSLSVISELINDRIDSRQRCALRVRLPDGQKSRRITETNSYSIATAQSPTFAATCFCHRRRSE